jgi:predicted secreted Zn-dependent protease
MPLPGSGGTVGTGGTLGTGGTVGAGGTTQGAGGDASGVGGSLADGACQSPFETLDISELDATETRVTYAATGNTAAEIRQSINDNRNDDWDAYTSWNLLWGFADCNGNGLTVSVEVNYRVPEWQEPEDADPDLVQSWQTYMNALFCHEYGHAEFGLEAALDVYEALDAIDAGGDCDQQQQLASAAFSSILSDYIALEIEYDQTTNHGATMGAVFPPPP